MHGRNMKLKDLSRDHAYDFTYPRCPQRYAAIEKKFPGLPLLIVDRETRLVWGHDYVRYLASRRLKIALVLEADVAPAAALSLNFNLSKLFFGLNLYEKLFFIKKISPFCPSHEIQRLADLDFTVNDVLLRRLDELLSVSLRRVLAGGRLGLKAAMRLIDFSSGDRRALLGLLLQVKFSESHQLLLMQWLEEIAFREKKSLARILAALRLEPMLEREMPQQLIMDAVNRRRFPAFSQQQREWRQWQKKQEVTGRIALAHAPFFANEGIQISLTVKNRRQAEEVLQKLKELGLIQRAR